MPPNVGKRAGAGFNRCAGRWKGSLFSPFTYFSEYLVLLFIIPETFTFKTVLNFYCKICTYTKLPPASNMYLRFWLSQLSSVRTRCFFYVTNVYFLQNKYLWQYSCFLLPHQKHVTLDLEKCYNCTIVSPCVSPPPAMPYWQYYSSH